jgi:hypothetical protein
MKKDEPIEVTEAQYKHKTQGFSIGVSMDAARDIEDSFNLTSTKMLSRKLSIGSKFECFGLPCVVIESDHDEIVTEIWTKSHSKPLSEFRRYMRKYVITQKI